MEDLATAILDLPCARRGDETAGRDERMLRWEVKQKDKKERKKDAVVEN
jgi:hypothetical protein